MRCGADVGKRNDYLSDSSSGRNTPDSFARKGSIAGAGFKWIVQYRRPATRLFKDGGHLTMAAELKIANRDPLVIWQSFIASLILIRVSLIPVIVGASGLVYVVGVLVLGSAFFYFSTRVAFRRPSVAARQLLAASIVYLPLVFILMTLDKK